MSNLDVSHEQRQIAEEKLQRKIYLRNEFLKQKSDPFAHAIGEGGSVFDSGFMRYQALKADQSPFFRPSTRNVLIGLSLMVIPMVGFGYLVNKSRQDTEASYRRGEVAYKDRYFKFT